MIVGFIIVCVIVSIRFNLELIKEREGTLLMLQNQWKYF